MSKLEKLPVFFVTIETLVNMYKQNEEVKFENLVVITDQRIPICKVYYAENKIIGNPYKLEVNKSKFISWRQKVVQFIVDDMIVRYQKGQTNRTLSAYVQKVFNFIDWIDQNNIVLNDDINTAKYAFLQYTAFLKSKIRDGGYSQGEAHSRHTYAYKLLNTIYQDSENIIGAGIKIIPNKRPNKVVKSQSEDQKYHYNFYYSFFHQVTDFLLENKSYPLKLKLQSGDLWCLPSRYTFFTSDKKFPMAFNPDNGTVRSEHEIKDLFNLPYLRDGRWAKQDFLKLLDTNNNYYSDKRFKLASNALKAFYVLFLSNTGMNDSTAATLEWSNDFNIEKERHKFRNIKYRAGNKPVEFQIQSKFLKDFKKYLLLRDYLLNGKEFEYLFFTGYGNQVQLNPNQKKGRFSSVINIYFTDNIDANLPRINSKQLRVNKTHQVIKTDGIIAASQLAQSSINTIINSYLGESQESSEQQFGEYFKNLNSSIFEKTENEIETSIGRCKQAELPDKKQVPDLFKNSCDYKEGCLFCKQYGLHIDKVDIQKLYSLKYVINECKYIAKDENHFTSIYGTVLKRISNIEEEILNTSRLENSKLKEYELDVFENENLHPYWENKLNTLISMGVLK